MTTLYPCRECAKKLLDNARTQANNAGVHSNERKFVLQPIGTPGQQSNKSFAWSIEQNAAASILERIALSMEFANI